MKSSPESASLQLLIVEDTPPQIRLIEEMLKDEQRRMPAGPRFEVSTAGSVSAAVCMANETRPDVILLDLGLPDAQGLDTLGLVKEAVKDVAIVILTGTDDIKIAMSAVRRGAQNFITKGQETGETLVRTMLYAVERQRLVLAVQQNEIRLRDVVNTLRDGIVVVDEDGIVLLANPAAVRLFGQKSVLVGATLGVPITAVGTFELDITNGDQPERRVVEAGVLPITWQGAAARLVTFHDITESKQTAEILENVATGVSAKTGESFFVSLTDYLVKLLHADYILIGELNATNQIKTIAFNAPDGELEDRVLALADTPCEQVIGNVTKSYSSGLKQCFPKDTFLSGLDIDAYLGTPLFDANGSPIGVFVVLWHEGQEDLSAARSILEIFAQRAAAELERKRAEEKVENERTFLQTVLDGVPDPVIVFGLDYQIQLMNTAARKAASFDWQTGSQQPCYKLLFDRDAPCGNELIPCSVDLVKSSGEIITEEQVENDGAGDQRVMEVQVAPVFDAEGTVTTVVESKHDITRLRRTEEALRSKTLRLDHLAHHDDLTQLPNRTLFKDRLRHSLSHAKRDQSQVGVLYLDLDRFKNVNDSLGHHIGDLLLASVARRLIKLLRTSDTVARFGGDEFAVLLERIKSAEDATGVAQKIIDALSRNFRIRNHEIHIGATIGVSIFPDDGGNGNVLLKHADAAMYLAKGKGRGCYERYTEGLSAQARSYLQIETNLSKALRNQEFELHYQPQVKAGSNRITGVEALLRWNNKILGNVAPDVFIPIAEESGLIDGIGQWVLTTACRQLRRWQQAGCAPDRLAVNLSPRQFQQPGLLDNISQVLEEAGVSPTALTLEITEGVIMNDVEESAAKLQTLSDMGVRVSIDDFGTGYSSLGYLRRFPIDELKIDKSFVSTLPGDENSKAIAKAIISLSKDLGYDVIAEGVETSEQLEFLGQNGCNFVQGYYFSRPATVDAILPLLQRRIAAPDRAAPAASIG